MKTESPLDLLKDLVEKACRRGADGAEVFHTSTRSMSYSQRLGRLEKLESAEPQEIGLRLFRGKQQVLVASDQLHMTALEALLDQGLAQLGHVPEDPFCGLEESLPSASSLPLEIDDPVDPTPADLAQRASAAEDAARSVPQIINSGGATATWARQQISLVNSRGFHGSYRRTQHSIVVEAIAGQQGEMEADSDWMTCAQAADLPPAANIGREAAARAVASLQPRKLASTTAAVVFDPRVSASLLQHFVNAIQGDAVSRGMTFLGEALGQRIFSEAITLWDDPTRKRGLRSRPFDGEGMPGQRRAFVEQGVLQSWMLDQRSARRLQLTSTGHGQRSAWSLPVPRPSNLYLEAGICSPQALLQSVDSGLYVTQLMGSAINPLTGDYSRGAKGFWIEKGVLTYPVSEVTIAGNLRQMFRELQVANDLTYRYGIDAPTVAIPSMTLAGR